MHEYKERAKQKRRALKAIKERRMEARDAAAVALLNDDAEAIAHAKSILEQCDVDEKALMRRKGAWEEGDEGRWHRDIELGDLYTVTALVQPEQSVSWCRGDASLKYDGSEVITTTLYTGTSGQARKRLDHLIRGMRAIVREELAPANPDEGVSPSV